MILWDQLRLDDFWEPVLTPGASGRDERATELLVRVGLGDRWIARLTSFRAASSSASRSRAPSSIDRASFLPTSRRGTWRRISGRHPRPDRGFEPRRHHRDHGDRTSPTSPRTRARIIRIKDGLVVADDAARPEPPAPVRLRRRQSARLPLEPRRRRENTPPSALRAMAANKARSALSMLGILIGVAAVIAMLAVGTGAQKAIEARLASLGSNLIMVFARPPNMNGYGRRRRHLFAIDLGGREGGPRASPGVVDIYPEAEGNVQIVYGDQNWNTEMQGVTPSYESIRNSTPYFGRFFTRGRGPVPGALCPARTNRRQAAVRRAESGRQDGRDQPYRLQSDRSSADQGLERQQRSGRPDRRSDQDRDEGACSAPSTCMRWPPSARLPK